MYINIRHMIGIPEFHLERLQDAGIFSVDDLIDATKARNLNDTRRLSGIGRSALINYGAMARSIVTAEKAFYRRVKGGYLLFVEEEGEEEPPDEQEPHEEDLRLRYGFKVVGELGKERHFVRTRQPSRHLVGDTVCIPPTRWIK